MAAADWRCSIILMTCTRCCAPTGRSPPLQFPLVAKIWQELICPLPAYMAWTCCWVVSRPSRPIHNSDHIFSISMYTAMVFAPGRHALHADYPCICRRPDTGANSMGSCGVCETVQAEAIKHCLRCLRSRSPKRTKEFTHSLLLLTSVCPMAYLSATLPG